MDIKDKNEVVKQAIRDGGYYDKHGIWNSIITIGDGKLYRKRVETLIIKNKKEVFCKKKPSGEYELPGGSTERDIPDMNQAVNECREEARINVINIQSTGITYIEISKPKDWMKNLPVKWDGYITDVYIGEYDGMDHRKVDQLDKDEFIASGRFYTFKECFKFFRKEHREALSQYIQNMNKDKEEVLKESYIGNYFKNKKLLKQIGKTPEVDISAIDSIISKLDKEYNNLRNTSKVKRTIEKGTAEDIFYPIINFVFPDKHEVSICLSFYPEFTDGAAIKTEEYGDIVMIYPCFFKNSKEGKRFTLLHELGHIRLGHLEEKNTHRKFFFGNDDTNDYRNKLAAKGKSMYTEINADLYAILSGAKMYSILDSASRKDYDKEYDYRVTNADLANRYSTVYKKFGNYKNLFEFSTYDMLCFSIHEFIQENSSNLNDLDKRNLFNFIYEYVVKEPIRNYSLDSRNYTVNKEYDKEIFNNIIKEYVGDIEFDNSFTNFINIIDSTKDFIYEYMSDLHNNFEYDLFTENTLDKSIYYYDEVLTSLLEKASENKGGVESGDILYNKKNFDNGVINLCFVTGYSGSGKSSLSRLKKVIGKVQHIDMDKAVLYIHREESYFKGESDCLRAYIEGPGQKFREEAIKIMGDNKNAMSNPILQRKITRDLFSFVKSYAASHKHTKFYCDGIWIYRYLNPNDLDKYAVYIKGTTPLIASVRGSLRGSNNKDAKKGLANKIGYAIGRFAEVYTDAALGGLKKFVNHFKPKYEKEKMLNGEMQPKEVSESVIYETKRSNLPDKAFGFIDSDGKRKYPLDTKKHVISAIRLFGHCPKSYEEELAHKILSRMKDYGISTDIIGEKNRLKFYVK